MYGKLVTRWSSDFGDVQQNKIGQRKAKEEAELLLYN